MELLDQLKIPKDRIAVLLGEKGKIKRQIEKATSTTLTINSKEGDVEILCGDGLKLLIAKNIVTAISRGFNPTIALQLTNEENCLEIVDIKDLTKNKTKGSIVRVRSRLIGSDGKARKLLEKLTNTSICVYGKTACIIGIYENAIIAKRAIINLILGSKHGNVYAFIEKEKRKHLSNEEIDEFSG
ncbi:RNA-processing protein [archaeon]|nr:RNA-processing protein [archaeon]|tara:strand:- start:10711 stop:11265 length:555 start_codon:yes stop_codon:yes gene_type:complete